MTHHEITLKLIGPVDPIGSAGPDAIRLKNLKDLIELTDRLLFDIGRIAQINKGANKQGSMLKAGAIAQGFLDNVADAGS